MATQTFTYTGSHQTWVVPADVWWVTFDGMGASGGTHGQGTAIPGKGGRVVCDVPVIPGETIRVYVGQEGIPGISAGGATGTAFNGGGQGVDNGSSGGGGSDIRRTPYAAYDMLAAAAGGGGCSNGTTAGRCDGGYGGYPSGLAGELGQGVSTASPGSGGGPKAPGWTGRLGSQGTQGAGGAGEAGFGSGSVARGSAGGGGGWMGGGGGDRNGSSGTGTGGGGGGGGGLSTGIAETITNDHRTGNGEVTLTWSTPSPPVGDHQFVHTGAYEEFTVPAGVNLITVDARGAEGAGIYRTATTPSVASTLGVSNPPGKGGRVQCDVTVHPLEVLRVYVGGSGHTPTSGGDGVGGFNGGGSTTGNSTGGGGGGATDIRRTPYALADRLIVAPGGGGVGGAQTTSATSGAGGDGATPTGSNGVVGGGAGSFGAGGLGGTSSAGGAGGSGNAGTNGADGSLGAGGNGGATADRGGGAGGSGYYGGGGGEAATATGMGGGGGGGSGLSTGAAETLTTGYQSHNGFLTVTFGEVAYPQPAWLGRPINAATTQRTV